MTIVVPVSGASGAASAATLASLSAAVAKWLNRTDLESVIPDFIRMAEAEFARDVRLHAGFQVVVDGGHAPAGDIPLPGDLLELQELEFAGQVLKELPYADWRRHKEGAFFARVGEVARVVGQPAGEFLLTYVQRLPQLVFSTDSSWLLRDHFDMYLWKSCEIGSVWLRDVEGAQGYSVKYEEAAQKLLQAINYRKWGGAPLAVQAPG
ncbi:MAG: hypothetical protein LBV14_15440, partial [Acidovorax sp.]|nr:hypothetical protein [Acidovorax sp.]